MNILTTIYNAIARCFRQNAHQHIDDAITEVQTPAPVLITEEPTEITTPFPALPSVGLMLGMVAVQAVSPNHGNMLSYVPEELDEEESIGNEDLAGETPGLVAHLQGVGAHGLIIDDVE
jgi:hypothetical protein